MSWIAAVAVLGIAIAPAVALAQGSPIVIRGKTYATWADWYASPEFNGPRGRCGTPSPWTTLDLRGGGSRSTEEVLGNRNDCSINRTNPADEYEPAQYWEVQVVVHRLESLTGHGVFPDALVQSQIDVLNEDFQAITGTLGEGGKNVRIVFRLATQDPAGNPSPGWTRTTNEFWFNDLPDPLLGTYYDALAWDPHRYLNIYTLSPQAPGGLILGYVPFLPQDGDVGSTNDGVRCLWNSFGRNSGNPPYDLGRTATHEVGHWFGLLHTFDGGCGQANAPACYTSADLVCDTEPDQTSHGGCPANANTCGDPDPIHNYMEYTDDLCMNQFTPEQSRRVRCTIQHYRPSVYEVSLAGVAPPTRAGEALALRVDPNPLRAAGHVSFRLARTAPVSLAIVDVAGRIVRSLASRPMAAGEHRLVWDGRDEQGAAVSPGAYFARIVTDGRVAAKRVILVH